MTRRRPADMQAGAADERALKAVEVQRAKRAGLLSILRGETALLTRAERRARAGDMTALAEIDRLAEAIARTANELRR